MHRVLFRVLAVVAVVVALGAAALSRVDAAFVVRHIADATARVTGRPLLFDSAPGITFFPPGVSFGQARWGEIVNGQGLALSVRGGMVQLELLPLLSGSVVVRAVRLDNPRLELRRSRVVDDAQKAPARGAAHSPAPAPLPDLPLELKRLVLRQASVVYADVLGQTLRISHMNLSVENLHLGQEAVVQCDFTFALGRDALTAESPARDKENTPAGQTAGTLALSARLRYAPSELAFRQTLLTLTPLAGALPGEAGPLQLTCAGTLDMRALRLQLATARLNTPQARLELTGEATLAPPAFKGRMEFEGSPRKLAALAGQRLTPAPPDVRDALRITSPVEYGQNSLSLSRMQARLDQTELSGALRLHLPPGAPLSLTADVRVGLVNLDHYQSLPAKPDTTGPGEAGAAPRSVAPGQSPPPRNLPALDVRAAVAGLRQGKLLLRDISFALTGAEGRYALVDFRGAPDTGGTLKASGSMDLPAGTCALKAAAADIRLGPLLEALDTARAVEGLAFADANLTLRCADLAALRHSLSGRGLMEIRQMRLPALSARISGLPGIGGKSGAVPERFDLVRLPFTARNGDVSIQPVSAVAAGFKLAGTARVSLPDQHLDARGTLATLGMRIPVVARGPFKAISFGLDPRLALDAVKSLPGALPDTGIKTGKTTRDAARGAGGLLRDGARGADGLVRGLLDR